MLYTLTINDKCIQDSFYLFGAKSEFESYLKEYLFQYEDDAKRNGYESIASLDFQSLVDLVWDLFNYDETDCFHCMVEYDGQNGTMLQRRNKEYLLIYHDKINIEKIERLTSDKLRSTIIELIPKDKLVMPLFRYSLEGLIRTLYEEWNVVDGDFWRIVFKLNSDGSCEKIEYAD